MKKIIIILFALSITTVLYGCNKKNKLETMRDLDAGLVEKLSLTKRIIVEDSIDNVLVTEISNSEDVSKFINVLINSTKAEDIVTSEGSTWYLEFYDDDDKLLSKGWLWDSGYFGVNSDKEYSLSGKLPILKEIMFK